MAKVIIRAGTSLGRTGAFEPGDIVFALEDTQRFGREELERTDLFLCLNIPGVPRAAIDRYIISYPGDELTGETLFQQRMYKIDITGLLTRLVQNVDKSWTLPSRDFAIEFEGRIAIKPEEPNPEFIGERVGVIV